MPDNDLEFTESPTTPTLKPEEALAAVVHRQPDGSVIPASFLAPLPSPIGIPKQAIRRGPAGPRKSRSIPIYYEEVHFPPEHFLMMYEMYRRGFAMKTILDRINPKQRAIGKPTISIVDLYTIFYKANQKGLVQQRREPSTEMTLVLFRRFFDAWRAGKNREQCMVAAAPYSNKYFVKKLYASLTSRYRECSDALRSLTAKAPAQERVYEMEQSIFRLGQQRTVENTPCWVIPLRKVPPYLLEIIKHTPTSGPLDDGGPVATVPMEAVPSPVPTLDLKPVSSGNSLPNQEVLEVVGPSTAKSSDELFDDMPLDDLMTDEPEPNKDDDFDESDPFK